MTDASQEGPLADTITARLRGELRWIDTQTNWEDIADVAAQAAADYFKSLGVPIDSLEQGRMERIEMRRYVTSDLQTAYVIVPDSTPEGAGE